MSAPTAEHSAVATSRSQPRRYELDWLRALAVFGLIPFHVAIIFSLGDKDYVANAQSSVALDTLATFVTFWGIPLLFVVAGASAWYALGTRTPRHYVTERFKRLLIPFIVGVLTIVPVQVYFGRLSDPSFHEPFLQFYVGYFLSFAPDKGPQYWAHLWFIPCLLAFSLVTLPLFAHLRGDAGQRMVARVAAWCARPGVILLFGLPLGISETILRSKPVATLLTSYLTYSNWALFVFFLVFFVYGYLLYADPRFGLALRRYAGLALLLGLLCWLAAQLLLSPYVRQAANEPSYDFTTAYVAAMFLRGFISWFWIMALVGFAMRLLTFSNGLLRYLNEAFYPVYVLHMTVLTVVGFYVVRWPATIWVKYAVVVAATLVLTLALYDLAISRTTITRALFGLKPRAAVACQAVSHNGRPIAAHTRLPRHHAVG